MSEQIQKTHIGTVVAVYPNKVLIEIDKFNETKNKKQEKATINDTDLRIGQFLEISDGNSFKFIVIIDNFRVEAKQQDTKSDTDTPEYIQRHIVEATPIGVINGSEFKRGCNDFAYPPKTVKPALSSDLEQIYRWGSDEKTKFDFCSLSNNKSIRVSVNGNKFFNKHFAIVGASGSGKSHTVAKILQNAIAAKNGGYPLNNSHIVVFDIHNEYKSAFPSSNFFDCRNLHLPYWMMNSDELEDIFIVTDGNDYNQRSIFQEAIVENKKHHFQGNTDQKGKIHFDSPEKFLINEVVRYIKYRNQERLLNGQVCWKTKDGKAEKFDSENQHILFTEGLVADGTSNGPQNGKLHNFINRLESLIGDKRLSFLFSQESTDAELDDIIKKLTGYSVPNTNITVVDLSGVPFEVLNITVSLISRILFDFCYFSKSTKDIGTPLLLVYEEAHKYVPNSNLAKYNSSRNAIERIAKEGRKYGITLGIVSQRPSEISETIFSQCSSFIAMRLTNPDDQSYVKKLLPDTLGNITETLPSLEAGEAVLIGESVPMPSIVKIDPCNEDSQPSSNDIKYFELWKEEWNNIDFSPIVSKWKEK